MQREAVIREKITSGQVSPEPGTPEGVLVRMFVSDRCGARGFSTGSATFSPGADFPYHVHTFSEALTVVEGAATVNVEERVYRMGALDCIHIPAGVAHSARNQTDRPLVTHSAFASPQPSRTLVEFHSPESSPMPHPGSGFPETLRKFAEAESYELSEGALFVDLFARRFGAKGICGGYGRFAPGASLPCHTHVYDESITIVEGRALCMVEGQRHKLSGLDTAFVPTGHPHRFFNDSEFPMSMIWVYAGDEPDRVLVEPGYCDGSLSWPAGDGKVKE